MPCPNAEVIKFPILNKIFDGKKRVDISLKTTEATRPLQTRFSIDAGLNPFTTP